MRTASAESGNPRPTALWLIPIARAYLVAMTRVTLFAGAILVVFLGVFAISRLTSPRQRPLMRVTTRNGDVMEFPVQMGRGGDPASRPARGGFIEPTLASFLKSAHVAEATYYADRGEYTKDIAMLNLTRPANTQLHIVSAGPDGMRMSAINTKSGLQCDLFAGDSAKWAFGYAYDPGRPNCGKLR